MRFFKWNSNESTMENIVENAVFPLFIIGLLFANLSGLGVFNNCFAESASHFGVAWKLAGIILFFYGWYSVWRVATDRAKWNVDPAIRGVIILAVWILSLCCYTGFNWWFNVCQ